MPLDSGAIQSNYTDSDLPNTHIPATSLNSITLPNVTLKTTNIDNGANNTAYVIGKSIGDILGTTRMEVAPLDYVANWIFEHLPTRVQNWYNLPNKNNILIKKAIEDNNKDSLLALISQGESPQKILIFSIVQRNIPVIKFLLTLDIDIHQYGVYPDVNTASTPYQAALISTYEIKKIFKEFDAKDKLVEYGPNPKNPWTLKFESVIKEINNISNNISYLKIVNEFGNTFYEPVINGKHYDFLEITRKMDWQHIFFENECRIDQGYNRDLISLYDRSYNTTRSFGYNIEYMPWINLYVSGESLKINAFLKGEDHYNEFPDYQTITKYWVSNACIANDLNKRGYPDPNQILFRGQSQIDRLVRHNHLAYISTSVERDLVTSYQTDSPIVVFDDNFGIDVTPEYIIQQTVFYPITLKNYQLFIIEGTPYHLAETRTLKDHECFTEQVNYNFIFEALIRKIASNPQKVKTHLNSNTYGQIYYDVVIDDCHYDMYELITNMDWHTLTLDAHTLTLLANSKYQLWDAQVYTNSYSSREGVELVKTPTRLVDINQSLKLLERDTVPLQCGEYACNYPNLYSDLSDTEAGLIFQYTSTSNKALNSFLKGSIVEFMENVELHKMRWSIPAHINEFDVKDPIQWWVYSARLINALNKIKNHDEQVEYLCRGQMHKDRHLRLDHSAPISFSSDLTICEKYNNKLFDSDIVLVNYSPHAKDITGLSFHPLQKEFLHPPAFLNHYKRKTLSEKSYLAAEITTKKTDCPKPVIKKRTEINNLSFDLANKDNSDYRFKEKIAYTAGAVGVIAICELYRQKRKKEQERRQRNRRYKNIVRRDRNGALMIL